MTKENQSAFLVLVIGFIAASLSGVAILLHAFGGVHLSFSIIVLAPMSLVLILSLASRAKGRSREIFLQRLGGGLFAGFMGLLAYDALRWLILILAVIGGLATMVGGYVVTYVLR